MSRGNQARARETWEIEKDFTFEAAHRLPHHDGKCARLHGHSWKCTIAVSAHSLQAGGAKVGMVKDFGDLAAVFQPVVENYLDHYYLNDSLGLENPTSEEVARWIHNKLVDLGLWVTKVVVQETCTSRCTYTVDRAAPLGVSS